VQGTLQPTDDKLSLIGAWSGHVTHYKILGSGSRWRLAPTAPIILLERLNLKSSNFVHELGYINSNNRMTYHQQKGVVMVTWLF